MENNESIVIKKDKNIKTLTIKTHKTMRANKSLIKEYEKSFLEQEADYLKSLLSFHLKVVIFISFWNPQI